MTTVLSSRLHLPLEMEKTRKAGNDKAGEAKKIEQSRSRSRHHHQRPKRPASRAPSPS